MAERRLPLFERTEASSAKFYEKRGKWFAIYEDAESGMSITLSAGHLPDDVKDIDDVAFDVWRTGKPLATMSTLVSFHRGSYRIEHDDAPFTRSQVTTAMEFAFDQVPKAFPNIVLPEGYPSEAIF